MSTVRGPCNIAVEAFLCARTGCAQEIAEVTGFPIQTVRNAIGYLRSIRAPCTANVRRKEIRARPQPVVEVLPAQIVESALATRSPLEQAWGRTS